MKTIDPVKMKSGDLFIHTRDNNVVTFVGLSKEGLPVIEWEEGGFATIPLVYLLPMADFLASRENRRLAW